jgi:hypothetical protein
MPFLRDFSGVCVIEQSDIMQFLALLILMCCIAISPACAELLQGGVQHREYLPQMPAELQAGSTYQEAAPPPVTIVWYPLPRWLAGKYESDYITNEVVQIYSATAPAHASSGAMVHKENFGLQLDNTGSVWHADILPKTSVWEGAQRNLQMTVSKECITTSNERIVLHIHNQSVILDPSNQRITHSEQVDGYKTITLQNNNGDLSVYDDIQEYDSNGSPLDRYIAKYTMHRIQNFAPQDYDHGIDLRASLAQFLTSIGRAQLIPTAASPETVPNAQSNFNSN